MSDEREMFIAQPLSSVRVGINERARRDESMLNRTKKILSLLLIAVDVYIDASSVRFTTESSVLRDIASC